jgi:hypothetical protein
MTALPTFEFPEVQIIVVCILFCVAICSCVYLYRLSYRAQFSIPIIRSEQGKRFYRYKLKSKGIWSHSIIKNSTDRFQNLNLSNKKNNELKLTNTSKRISLLDNYNDLPLVSIVVPARNEQNRIERCILSLLDRLSEV